MPQCCVPGCKPDKGVLLKCFPKDQDLCIKWIKNINRPNWIPNHHHRICQLHFAPEMWEKTRVDGTRKLKLNAVPTLFGEQIIKKNANATNIVILPSNDILENKQKLMKVVSSKNTKSSQAIMIPASTIKTQTLNSAHTIFVDKHGKIINPSTISKVIEGGSILKSTGKSVTLSPSQMIISRNANILKHQIEASSNRMPIVIPANSSIVGSQVKNLNSKPPLIDVADSDKTKIIDNQSNFVTLPIAACEDESNITKCVKSRTALSTNITHSKSTAENMEICSSENSTNINQQISSMSTSTGIILNKIEAKKIEDKRFERMDRLLLQQLKMNGALRKKLSSMKNKMQQIMKEKDNDYKELMRDVFTDDQIRALELKHVNPKTLPTWSNKTMLKAVRLKELCGSHGYEELLKQNLPLPSVRTITRWCHSKDIPVP